MTTMSLPPSEIDVSTEAFEASLRDARHIVGTLRVMAAMGHLGRDGSATVGDVVVPLDEWRMYVPEVDVALTLAGDPFHAGPFPAGLLSNAGKSGASRPRPARFVLPADRLSDRPLGEFAAMARRRDGDGWATVKRY